MSRPGLGLWEMRWRQEMREQACRGVCESWCENDDSSGDEKKWAAAQNTH